MTKIRKILYILVIYSTSAFFSVASANDFGSASAEKINDPIEEVNRAVHGFNTITDKYLFHPIAKTYRFIFPKPVRNGVRNVLNNLSEPVTVINSVLQGDVKNSGRSLYRFTVNSTVGLAGIFDIAQRTGVEQRSEDFGQTLGKHKIGAGPYIVLPIIGPSNARDTVGLVVDAFSDPFNYILDEDVILARTIATGVDKKEQFMDLLKDVEETSLDPYATLRSMYAQRRASQIKNGVVKHDGNARN